MSAHRTVVGTGTPGGRRRLRAAAAVPAALLLAVPAVAGCEWNGIESMPLPGAAGHGDGAYTVTIEMPDVTTITRNSPVMVDDAVVGSITELALRGWHAEVTVTIDGGTELPADTVASVGQTSLLGSSHIELSTPADGAAAGTLADGDVIPLERAGAYPTTEQTLSALSLVLNGGGLGQVREITGELNDTLDGRAGTVGHLVGELDTLMGTLDGQREQISSALDGLDRLSATVAGQNSVLDTALVSADGAVDALAQRRTDLTAALTALGEFGDTARRVIDAGGHDLVDSVADLTPVLRRLADAGKDLTGSLSVLLTFPFPMNILDNTIRGDYSNLFMTLDLTVPRIKSDMLHGSPLGRQAASGEGALGSPAGLGADAADPLLAPLTTEGGTP
ncbi:MCE family protein [Tomitella fengzijianii]|uniref:MCE family protein n=1 Tax=Tomitella fengzijianii TaxID=2597660 RepID=A0A516X6E9_9ACTN|nr:MCE family protein [Tomitella fengzijianii]QDQ98652.1 MCE family protein [Tomitella fengzijianii]